ncbi:MAG: FAD:protein FMN transferase, partial [Ignavibacteriae bacterium]
MNGNGKIRRNSSSRSFTSLRFFTGDSISFFTMLLIIIFTTTGCTKKTPSADLKNISGKTMGTTFSIKIVDGKNLSTDYKSLESEINELLKEINRQMSTYIEESEISQFNNFDSTGWFNISYDFASLLNTAMDVSSLSAGAFDVTVGPLVNLWGFGPEIKKPEVPGVKELLEAKSKTGYKFIEVRVDTPAVKKDIPEVYLDMSAIAKGYAVDKVAELISSKKIINYMVEIGGEVRTAGKNNKDESWKIGIETPDSPANIQKVISISNYSIATSGDYNNYFEENGTRYSHTIDPRTGMPITHKLASVTVIHTSCALADAYATAINVMGPAAGYDFALEENLIIYMIVREETGFTEKTTSQFSKF